MSHVPSIRATTGLALCFAFGVLGCGTPLTEVLVVVDTDMDVPGQLDEIRIDVIGPDGTTRRSEGGFASADELPRTLGLVHRGGALGPVAVTVTGLVNGANVVQRRARFDFVEGQARILRITLLDECTRTRCVGDETCAEMGCRAITVAAEELEPYSPQGVTRTDGGVLPDGDVDAGPCEPLEETCNGMDDDCDGMTDEDFDLATDPEHCGACGTACAADPMNASSACEASACTLTCDKSFADCNSDDTDGCETPLDTTSDCGSCGNTCSGGTPFCQATADSFECAAACLGGLTDCSGSCVDLTSTPSRCGACTGAACEAPANASPTCVDSMCGFECDPGAFDCDGDETNGCESDQRELANCGSCGSLCERQNATVSCATGACEILSCGADYGNCDAIPDNGCEQDTQSSLAHCGGCGAACPMDPVNASVSCVTGSCVVACDPGFGDCDGTPGCETDFSSPATCGSCTVGCGAGETCSSTGMGFSCTVGCASAAETNCGGSCVDTNSSTLHCGGCDTVCPSGPNSTATCSSGMCGVACDPGFADCDGMPANGCEVDLNGSTAHCGGCGNACPTAPNSTASCQAGLCSLACSTGFADCDGMPGNGCEIDVNNDTSHCGSCTTVCTAGPNVAGFACTAGVCTITSCDPGWGDCNPGTAGCETNVNNARSHCGMCGNRCQPLRCCTGVCC